MNANTNTLGDKCMLVTLTISAPTFKRLDKKATRMVNDAHNTTDEAGKYRKAAMAKDILKDITKIVNEARAEHYRMTLPWVHKGPNILSSAMYMDYQRIMGDLENRFWQAVEEFLANYPDHVAMMRAVLNGLFNIEDYPETEILRNKYKFSFSFLPFPTAADFRVNLNSAEVDKIKADLEQQQQVAIESAMRDIWERLHKATSHMVEKLNSFGKPVGDNGKTDTFRDSLVNNLCDIVQILPKLNITNDPTLARLGQDIEKTLCSHDPKDLRENKELRKETAANAQDILDQMAGYCG